MKTGFFTHAVGAYESARNRSSRGSAGSFLREEKSKSEKQNQADSKREIPLDVRYRSAVAWARSELDRSTRPTLLYGLNFTSPASMLLKTLLIRQTDHGFYFHRVSARTLGLIVNALQTDEATYDLCQYLIAAGDLYEARRALHVEIDGEYVGYRALNALPGQLRWLHP